MSNKAETRSIRVLYAATYYVDQYVRQTVIQHHLRHLTGVSVETLIVNRRGWIRYGIFLWRFLWLRKNDYDAIYLGWRTVELAPLLRLLTRQPIIVDAFVPIFETMCHERKTVRPRSLIGRLVHWWEGLALRLADAIVTDTATNADYFSEEYRLDRKRFVPVLVGVDRSIYLASPPSSHHQGKRVFFYGTFLPLHGVTVIIEAAKILRDRTEIVWQLLGDGPERPRAEELVKQYGLTNVHFLPRISQTELAKKIAEADICLGGPFSDSPKAQRVITGKTFQFLAMGKPVIVGKTSGNQELLINQVNCLMVAPGDAQALAVAVRQLVDDIQLRHRLVAGFHDILKKVETATEQQLQALLTRVTRRSVR